MGKNDGNAADGNSRPPTGQADADGPFSDTRPYEVGGLSWKELSGSTVELERFPILFVHAIMGLNDVDQVSEDLRTLDVVNVDAMVAHLVSRGYSRIETNVVLSLEAQRIKQDEVRAALNVYIDSGALILVDPLLKIATRTRRGALVRFDEAAELLFTQPVDDAVATKSEIPKGSKKLPGAKAPERHCDLIVAAILKRGLNPLKLAPAPAGNKPWPLREAIALELNLTKAQMKKAMSWARKIDRIVHSDPGPPDPAPI